MRKLRSLGIALVAMALMAGPVLAGHETWVTFNPASPVVEGTVVEVAANSDPADDAPKLQLWVCQAAAEGTPTVPAAYLPYAACEEDETGDAVWVLLVEQGGSPPVDIDYLPYDFDTTGLGGQLIGFKSHRDPGPNVNHPDASGFADLTVNVAGNGNGEHPGCKGGENAYEQVTTNNGSTQSNGRAKEALEKVMAKLGCQ
jgi:hypothetical protein